MRRHSSQITIVHVAASPFLGGPERQMLGLALVLPAKYRSAFVAFPDRGSSRVLLNEADRLGFATVLLRQDAPRYGAAVRELARQLRLLRADLICCHGYKPDILGWRAARMAGIPAVGVAHGWTGATLKVRVNEAADRWVLRRMDRVVCVSEGQAVKTCAAGVPKDKLVVIRNAVRDEAFTQPDPEFRAKLQSLFPTPMRHIVGAAGRLSIEKGFDQLVEAAALVRQESSQIGFVVFGDGPLRGELASRIAARGLQARFVLAGFTTELERYLPNWDAAVLPSFTEGLPVVVLEAFAAGVPVVATAVGGTPEVVLDGENGYLVPPRQPAALAARILDLLSDEPRRAALGENGRRRVRSEFTFATQCQHYERLFEELLHGRQREPVRVRT